LHRARQSRQWDVRDVVGRAVADTGVDREKTERDVEVSGFRVIDEGIHGHHRLVPFLRLTLRRRIVDHAP
jgi:hypothetical protein